MEQDHLTLKWGTLKAWNLHSKKSEELLKEYHEIGSTFSAMAQHDTLRQKEIICEMIEECNDPEGIYLDWDGKYITKQEAKEYVMSYGNISQKKKNE